MSSPNSHRNQVSPGRSSPSVILATGNSAFPLEPPNVEDVNGAPSILKRMACMTNANARDAQYDPFGEMHGFGFNGFAIREDRFPDGFDSVLSRGCKLLRDHTAQFCGSELFHCALINVMPAVNDTSDAEEMWARLGYTDESSGARTTLRLSADPGQFVTLYPVGISLTGPLPRAVIDGVLTGTDAITIRHAVCLMNERDFLTGSSWVFAYPTTRRFE